MSTAIMGTPYSPPSPPATSSSATMSPTMSPVYPDRPIRPMPKRSLRARLSSEVAETITYPPAPPTTNSVFYIPYADAMAQRNGTVIKNALKEIDKAMYEAHGEIGEEDRTSYRFKGNELESEEEEDGSNSHHYEERRPRQGALSTLLRSNTNGIPKSSEKVPPSVASSNDSADGYDSFENTNNKKKRKIPTSGALGNHHSSLSASLSHDLANMGLSNGDPGDSLDRLDGGVSHYYGSGSSATPAASGTGLSGAGRGRYGRSGRRDASGRSPLTSLTNSSSAWQHGRPAGAKREHPLGGAANKETNRDHGIISQAIADAAALPTMPANGQENMSLLEQQSVKKSPSTSTQFTFTCESDTSKGMVWPGENSTLPASFSQNSSQANPPPGSTPSSLNHQRKDFSTQGTQTSPSMGNQLGQNSAHAQSGSQAPPKPRRSAAKRYAMAARERRAQQQYNNFHHPPREEDFWTCDFCEYESIFGRPPEALIRQYEIKDRKERKRLAEKRRLLEKAKMKGRKGKKNGKNAAKASAAPPPQSQGSQQTYSSTSDARATQSHGTQSEEYYADEYDDEHPIQMPPPPSEMPTRIPQPISQQPGQSTRAAHGTVAPRPA